MARGKGANQKRRRGAGKQADNGARPEPRVDHAPKVGAPAADPVPRAGNSPGVIFTSEGMIEERDWREPRMRERRPEEKSLEELVASVLARPAVEEPAAEDAAPGFEWPAEDEGAEALDEVTAEDAEDREKASRRRIRVLAILAPVAFIVAAAAILFGAPGGGSDSPSDPGAVQPVDQAPAPPEGGGVPPADSQVAAQPPPAPEAAPAVVPAETPAPPPPSAPVVTDAPPPPPPPTAAPPPPSPPPPPPPPPPTEIHIGDLDGATPGQKVAVRISVHDAAHNPVSGVTVTGQWGGGHSGTASCVTDGSGWCGVRTENLSKADNVTFTVLTLSLSGAVYAGGANHDPDGDSSGTSITIAVAA